MSVYADGVTVPRVTYPYGRLSTLSTNVAWMGDIHSAFEVRIGTGSDPEKADIWRSGVVDDGGWFLKTPVLPSGKELRAFVRLRNESGWGNWGVSRTFVTPAAPVVRIDNPEHAGRVKAVDTVARWTVESDLEVTTQSVSVDRKQASSVDVSAREFKLSGLREGVHSVSVTVSSGGKTVSKTSQFYVYKPVQLPANILYRLDVSSLMKVNVNDPAEAAKAFDTLHLAGVLQGIVNRDKPRLYLNYTRSDNFWLARMRDPGGYLERAIMTPVSDVQDLLFKFNRAINGAVVWDPQAPATSNVASTICGVENLVPVRYDETPGSMYDLIIKNGPKLKVVHNLVGKFTGKGKIPETDLDSTGSPKCDAYLWAKVRYLDSGKCNPLEMGYWCDGFWLKHPQDMSLDDVGLTNHDFIVARKGFITDLHVVADEAPRDDPGQRAGLDRETFQQILLSCYKMGKGKMIHVCGFTPWGIKYTNARSAGGKHDPVRVEWETAKLLSAYNAFVDADAIGYVEMANASVYQHAKLPDRLVQNPPPTRQQLEAKGYIDSDGNIAPFNFIYHYLGDYDSAAWMYLALPGIWKNPVRGQVPSGWAFNPNLIERLPVAFKYFYDTKTPNDYFVAGDSGAGYVNPTQLLPPRKDSGLPSGADSWIEHNTKYFRQLNYSIVGFIINGLCFPLTVESHRMFLPFSGDGIMTQGAWIPEGSHLLESMLVAEQKRDISGPGGNDIEGVAKTIIKDAKPGQTAFLSYRSILVGPDWPKSVNDKVRELRPDCRFEPVDPYTYFYLLRHSLGGKNECRATYTFDTAPAQIRAGQKIKVLAGVRNDGWETWKSSGDQAVRMVTSFVGAQKSVSAVLPYDIEPGQAAVVEFNLTVPDKAGNYALRQEMVRGKDWTFSKANDLAWEKEVKILD